MGDAPVLSYFSFFINPQPKPTGVLEHCRAGENNYFSQFLWHFL
jgi:hypothetical protein